MALKTPLYNQHLSHHAMMVDFHGWMMPLHYGSQLQEHQSTRQTVGLFDISHMSCIDIEGVGVKSFLLWLLANSVNKIKPGEALYTCMLNKEGGIIDDLIVYQRTSSQYRLVFNSSTLEKVLAWLTQHVPTDISFIYRSDMAMIAVQGPQAQRLMQKVWPQYSNELSTLRHFAFMESENKTLMISRTGYTGEDGFELMMDPDAVVELWQRCVQAGAQPCGLGARDTLRLEAGLNLNGSDMDSMQTPLSSNLGWTVAWDEREFMGKSALVALKATQRYPRLHGVVTPPGRYVLRAGMRVTVEGGSVGVVTSGTWSPTLERGIAFARFESQSLGCAAHIDLRGKPVTVEIVKTPFYVKSKASQSETVIG